MQVDPNYASTLTSSLNNVQAQQEQFSSELSSGVRVNQLSDDPAAAGENVLLLNSIQQDDTFTQTSNSVTGQLQVADTALGSIVTELTSAIQLATEANNGTNNASNVESISNQLTGIRSEVESLANTSYQGSFLFAGNNTTTAPFSTSASTSPAVTSYSGDSGINYLEAPNGEKIQLNIPGNQIFQGSGNNNVFQALNNLIADYSTGTVDSTKAVSDTEALNTALNYLSQQRVTLDNSINQVTSASSAATNGETQLTAAQTNLMQADVAQISTQLALTETQQTALESVISQLDSQSNSLFSKLS
jgi:flagellar hook-associated protein 3 FlgL